ncbi:hypothetical protein Tcan_01635 [Toxocara canis]|uniref:Uncharacterized protein n=1 Tax=Toxocara canis TaxID=6265 RepID=A0A0B2VTV7_TOXCA|nr:hypothetical protein Tcan_01635 [Toxocara canis]
MFRHCGTVQQSIRRHLHERSMQLTSVVQCGALVSLHEPFGLLRETSLSLIGIADENISLICPIRPTFRKRHISQALGSSSIVVSTPRCGRGDTGSIPVLGMDRVSIRAANVSSLRNCSAVHPAAFA